MLLPGDSQQEHHQAEQVPQQRLRVRGTRSLPPGRVASIRIAAALQTAVHVPAKLSQENTLDDAEPWVTHREKYLQNS